jgi:hypothetical protein
MADKVLNIVAFQVGWLACVLGAGYGKPYLGPVVVVVLVGVYLALRPHPVNELGFLLTVAILGTMVDSLLATTGILSYKSQSASWMAPVWISALWMNFATTIRVSMKWLDGHPVLAALIGAVAGPLAYYAGSRLGAIELTQPKTSLAVLAIVWALSLPGMYRLSQAVFRSGLSLGLGRNVHPGIKGGFDEWVGRR